ncbi:hypothetical protein AB0C51_05305 [Streptomyces pathocidini]|uniref:hypothetical protein n=1 Tax=Streptomyces pathocidini TaxID=1650571 RepID=UPI0033F84E39
MRPGTIASVYLESVDDVENYKEVFDDLSARALDPSETRIQITQIIKELQQ